VIVGTVRELKPEEYRVGLTPEGVDSLVRAGHQVLVEAGAGLGSGFDDGAYRLVGAEIVPDAAEVWKRSGLLVKVKEPQPQEYGLLHSNLIVFTYLHLAALPDATRAFIESGAAGIAYETVQLPDGTLPLLVPMSQIAGRMATEVAAQWLRRPGPGRGKLMSGPPGVPPARVVILGSGTVARNALAIAVGLGAEVTVIGQTPATLRPIEERWQGRVRTVTSTPYSITRELAGADALISGVLVVGARAPKLVSREQVRSMGAGAVIVNVDIDQGGAVETARQTTHADPVYVEEGVVHYSVANMPGSVPQTATGALTAATLAYVMRLAREGLNALKTDRALASGANVVRGYITNQGVADATGMRAATLADVM
jgi:alanine dehydrogenase